MRIFVWATAIAALFISGRLEARPQEQNFPEPIIGEIPSSTLVSPQPQSLPPLATTTATEPQPTAFAQSPDQSSPLQFRIGDATITPVGFMDLTNTFRSTNSGTSLQTNFGSIPYNNVLQGRLTEDNFSAANSRIGFRVDARVKEVNVLAYYESDFVGGIGNAAFNTQVSSNSLLYRIRLYWVDLRKNKYEVLAGQSWSMITPNRKQISPLPADLFYSEVIDVNYMNGLTWGRIPGMRFLYHPSEKVTMGVSLEQSTQYFGGSGGGGVPVLPAALATAISPELDQNLINGIQTPRLAPDVIGKIAFDPNSRLHFEFAGVVSEVRLLRECRIPLGCDSLSNQLSSARTKSRENVTLVQQQCYRLDQLGRISNGAEITTGSSPARADSGWVMPTRCDRTSSPQKRHPPIDARIVRAWESHPRRFFVEPSPDFLTKAARALEILRGELPECCAVTLLPHFEVHKADVVWI
jgi:hypothetical protein